MNASVSNFAPNSTVGQAIAQVHKLRQQAARMLAIDDLLRFLIVTHMSVDAFLHHPIEILEEALHIRRQIDALQKQLSSLFGNHPPSLDAIPIKSGRVAKAGKRTMSPEARERLAAAKRERRAKVRTRKRE